jgi:hypothetical protein
MKRYHVLNIVAVLLAAVIVVIWAQVFLLIFPGLGFGGIATRATPVLSPTATVVLPPSPSRSLSPSPSPSLPPPPSPSPSPSPPPVSPTPTLTPPTPTPVPLAATPTVFAELLGVERMPVTGAIVPYVSWGSAMALLLIASGALRRWLKKRE